MKIIGYFTICMALATCTEIEKSDEIKNHQFIKLKNSILNLYDSSKYDEALTILFANKSSYENNSEWKVKFGELEGALAQATGDHKRAEIAFDNVLKNTSDKFLTQYKINALYIGAYSKMFLGKKNLEPLFTEALRLCEETQNFDKINSIKSNYAAYLSETGNNNGALELIQQISQSDPNNHTYAYNYAISLYNEDQFQSALQVFFELLDQEKIKNDNRAQILIKISDCFLHIYALDKANKYLKMVDFNTIYDVTIKASYHLMNGQLCLNGKPKFEIALASFHRFRLLAIQSGNPKLQFLAYLNLSTTLGLLGDEDSCDYYFQKAQHTNLSQHEFRLIYLNELKKTIENNDHLAFHKINSNLDTNENASNQFMLTYYNTLYKYYNQNDSFELALIAYRRLRNKLNEKQNTDVQNAATFYETKYQTQQKEQKITLLEKEQALKDAKIKSRNQLMIAGGTGLGIALLLALFAVRNQQQKQQAQQALLKQEEASKQQIEQLFKDQNHRVQNSLMAVTNALHHDRHLAEDDITISTLAKNIRRVDAVKIIHQNLYQNKTDDQVELSQYIKQLTADLLLSLGFEDDDIQCILNLEKLATNAKTATHLGLFITEVITNAAKYAFSKNGNNQLKVRLKKISQNEAILEVSDNGPGFNWDEVDKRGLELLLDQVASLKSNLKVDTSNGTHFSLTFKT